MTEKETSIVAEYLKNPLDVDILRLFSRTLFMNDIDQFMYQRQTAPDGSIQAKISFARKEQVPTDKIKEDDKGVQSTTDTERSETESVGGSSDGSIASEADARG